MSNADSDELVTTSSDGVTVEKSFEPDDFPVPAIAFTVRSEREETVSIRLVDTVPERVAPEDIGFHPKYGAEFWSVDGETIVFEREFEPDEEYVTVYGLRGSDADDADDFMSEPRLESVDPPGSDGDSGQVVRDVIEGDDEGDSDDHPTAGGIDAEIDEGAVDANGNDSAADADPDREDSAADAEPDDSAADEPEVSIELPDPDDAGPGEVSDADGHESSVSGDTETTEPHDPATTAGSESGASEAAGTASHVSALTAELRSGDVDDDDLAELRDALGVDLASASVEARIEHLQSEVASLEAYTDALEAFLDENGDAQRLLRELREELEATSGRLTAVEETAEAAATTADAVDDRLEERLESVESRLESELEEFESMAADVESRVDDRLEELDDVVEERLEAELDELWTAVDEAAADAADAADGVGGVREELEELEADLEDSADERLDELEDDVESLSEEMADLAEMRDRLASALGGLAGDEDA